MSNERTTPDPDGVRDNRVSRTYGELSTERAPDALNRTVLRKAEKAAQPAYRRSVLWTKPVAWAAVVAICLAITLQVTQIPMPENIPDLGELVQDDRAISSEALDDDALPAGESAKAERKRSLPREAAFEPATADAPAASSDEGRAALQRYATEADRQPAAPVDATLEESVAPLAGDYEMQDADMLRRAEDMVRQRTGDNKETENVAYGVSALAPATASASIDLAGCSDESRRNPDDWLTCIVRLEQAGMTDEAAVERQQLLDAYPDFELPDLAE